MSAFKPCRSLRKFQRFPLESVLKKMNGFYDALALFNQLLWKNWRNFALSS